MQTFFVYCRSCKVFESQFLFPLRATREYFFVVSTATLWCKINKHCFRYFKNVLNLNFFFASYDCHPKGRLSEFLALTPSQSFNRLLYYLPPPPNNVQGRNYFYNLWDSNPWWPSKYLYCIWDTSLIHSSLVHFIFVLFKSHNFATKKWEDCSIYCPMPGYKLSAFWSTVSSLTIKHRANPIKKVEPNFTLRMFLSLLVGSKKLNSQSECSNSA